jgi:sialate O-acetylesterase
MGVFLLVFSMQADVRLSEIFGSRMVVQRDKPLIVWGEADPDEAVSVAFSEQIRVTVADRKGHWQVTFDPVAFDPEWSTRSLNIRGNNQITIDDVVVGDLWLWAGENTPNYPREDSGELVNQSDSLDHSGLHWFAMDSVSSDGLKIEVPAKWNRLDISALDKTGSAAEVFAVELHQKLGVPIGIILATEPRTSIESWISPASNKTKSAGIFNAMIAPLALVSFSGVIWDHGESNLNHSVQYRRLLPLLIHDWRSVFHDDNLPFLIVQLRAREFAESERSSG